MTIQTIQLKPLTEITHEAIRVLSREIGIVNTIRIINQYTTGYGNYTEEREQMFGDMTLQKVVSEIKQARNKNP